MEEWWGMKSVKSRVRKVAIVRPCIDRLSNAGLEPQIWPTQKFWRGAPMVKTHTTSLRTVTYYCVPSDLDLLTAGVTYFLCSAGFSSQFSGSLRSSLWTVARSR